MKEQQQGGGAGIFWGLAKHAGCVGLSFAVVGLSPGTEPGLPSPPDVGEDGGCRLGLPGAVWVAVMTAVFSSSLLHLPWGRKSLLQMLS